MRARARTAALTATLSVLAAGAAAGLAPSATASTAGTAGADSIERTPGYSLHHITVNVEVGPGGDTDCLLNADLYKPDHTSRTHKRPAILTTNGFGGSKDDSNETAIGKGFVREGYVVLAYSGLGFGGSGCKIHLDDPAYDGKAGSQLVDVLAGTHPYTSSATGKRHHLHYVAANAPGDPKVGMIGGSYGGEIQFAVAEQDPRVDAIIPIITWNDLSYSLAPNDTSLSHGVTYRTPGVAKKEWTGLFFGEGIIDGVEGAQVDPSRDFPPCPNFADDVCAAATRLLTLGYPDPTTLHLARHASVATYMRRIHVPTLLAQGEQDTLFNLQEAAATFRALHKQGTPVRMIWQSWGHSHSTPAPGELDFSAGSLDASYEGRRFLNWMDHYVKGERTAPVGARFAYFRDWVHYDTSKGKAGHAVEKAYAERSRFSQRPTASLFFTGSDALTSSRRHVQSGSASYANTPGAPTSYSETSGLEGNQVNQQPFDTAGTFAGFTSKPLAHGVAMVGSPRLTLHLKAPVAALSQSSGPGGKLILFAKVYDVAPDGTASLPERLIAPVRVSDVTKPVHVTLPGVVHRFAKGHRIRVVIAASDFAYANNAAIQPVTVTTSEDSPSVLRLPLTGELRF